jgi:hypothetical protein
MFRQADLSQFFLGKSGPLKRQNEQRTQYFRDYEREKCTIKFRNMTRQKTAWFVQYKDNREIIVVKRIICCLNPFTTTTKFFISILK